MEKFGNSPHDNLREELGRLQRRAEEIEKALRSDLIKTLEDLYQRTVDAAEENNSEELSGLAKEIQEEISRLENGD